MHSADHVDLHTGYEWWLMKEAKARNPDIKLCVTFVCLLLLLPPPPAPLTLQLLISTRPPCCTSPLPSIPTTHIRTTLTLCLLLFS